MPGFAIHTAGLILALAPAIAPAAPTTRPAEPRPFSTVLAELDSPDHIVRTAAGDALLLGVEFPLSALEAALASPNLSAEQRLRLEAAAFRLFADSPRAALGVQFAQAMDRTQIESLRPGFPSSATLKPGDVIIRIGQREIGERRTNPAAGNGLVFSSAAWSLVRAVVISYDPGQAVPVTVVRNGQNVDVQVTLGRFNDLGPGSGATTDELQIAWALRSARQRGPGDPAQRAIDATTLRPQRDPGAWGGWSGGAGGGGAAIDVIDAGNASKFQSGESPSVVVGAAPDAQRQADRAAGYAPSNGFARAFAQPAVNGVFGDVRDLHRLTDAELTARRQMMANMVVSFQQMAEQRNLDPMQRRSFQEQASEALRMMNVISREFDRRNAARRAAPDANPVPALAPAPAPDVKPDVAPDPVTKP